MKPTGVPVRSRRWLVFLVGGIVGTIVAGVSGSFVAAALAAQVFGWWGSMGAFSASRKLPGAASKAWKFFGTAGLAFLIAGIVRTVHGMVIDVERPFPSPADVFVTDRPGRPDHRRHPARPPPVARP